MQYYAIQHKETGCFIAGTDFSRTPSRPRQIFSSPWRPPLLFHGDNLAKELRRRHIDTRRYRVVIVEIRKAEL